MQLNKLKEFKDKKVAILWYWKEGKSIKRFLQNLDFKNIFILDKNEINDREESISYVTWENYLDNLNDFDLIIKTPWISPYTNDPQSRWLTISSVFE